MSTEETLAGLWKRVNVENGIAFGVAMGLPEVMAKAQATGESTVEYEKDGDNWKVTRVHAIGDLKKKSVNSFGYGSAVELEFQGNKITADVSGDAGSLLVKASFGTATAEIQDGKLIEKFTHTKSGQTMTSTFVRN